MKKPDPATLLSPAGGEATDGAVAPSAGQALVVGSMFGGYRILRAVGGGGMGQVYEAFDADLNRSVAVKVMRPDRAADPDSRERFLREARALAAVTNPHVVTIHHVGQHDNQPFLVMEMVAGETLDARLRGGPVPMLQLLNTAREIAAGLAAAHRAGVVHRDIKPDNVVLAAGEDRAKLIDFGLAHTARFGDDEHASVGTPLYMAPEQVRGTAVTPRTDLFSFGVVLYRMATGKTPFEGTTMTEWRDRLLSDVPPVPPDELNPAVPPPLSGLIHRLLARDPADRPETARAVEWELSSLLQSLVTKSGTLQLAARTGPTPAPAPLMTPLPTANTPAVGTEILPPSRRAPWWVWVAVGGVPLVIALIVGVFLLTQPREGPTVNTPTTQAVTPPSTTPVVRPNPIHLFDGSSLKGWRGVGGQKDYWTVRDRVLIGQPRAAANQYLLSEAEFGDHELEFEFRWPDQGSHNSVYLWAVVDRGKPDGLEVNLNRGPDEATDKEDARWLNHPWYAAGGVHKLNGPIRSAQNVPAGKWNKVKVTAAHGRLKVEWNGRVTLDEALADHAAKANELPALNRRKGVIAIHTHNGRAIEFRDITVTPLGP